MPYLVDSLAIRPHNPDINIQEASLSDLEHETHLGARLHLRAGNGDNL